MDRTLLLLILVACYVSFVATTFLKRRHHSHSWHTSFKYGNSGGCNECGDCGPSGCGRGINVGEGVVGVVGGEGGGGGGHVQVVTTSEQHPVVIVEGAEAEPVPEPDTYISPTRTLTKTFVKTIYAAPDVQPEPEVHIQPTRTLTRTFTRTIYQEAAPAPKPAVHIQPATTFTRTFVKTVYEAPKHVPVQPQIPKRTVTRTQVPNVYADEEGECLTSEECTCVSRDICQRGYIVEDGSGVVQRRGKRSIILGDFLDTVLAGGRRHCYSCGSHGSGSSHGFGGFVGVRLGGRRPLINVNIQKHKEVSVISDGGCGGGVCGSRPRLRPRPTVVQVDVPFVKVNVDRTVTSHRDDGDGSFVPCPTCGGSSKPKPVPAHPPVHTVTTTTFTNQKLCPTGQVCCRSKSAVTPDPEVVTNACGLRNACGVDRRTGASTRRGECEFGEWPWQAIILRDVGDGQKEFLCNAVLIGHKRVLTVAQCVDGLEHLPGSIEVRLGDWDVSSEVEVYPHETYYVETINIHQNYKNETLFNDIAILELTATVKYQPHISPICLPPAKQAFAFGSCVVTGWSRKDPVMRESYVECLDDEDCQHLLRQSALGPHYKLHHSFLCAYSKESKSCQVAGGGPLVCKREDGSYALVGLVSWGVECGTSTLPEVFVRVQNYLDWIDSSNGAQGQNHDSLKEQPNKGGIIWRK